MAKTLYTLKVCLFNAPVSEEFAEANPVVCRTIEIRGDQTLRDLHAAVFAAFDRWEEHMYEFHFGNGPHDYSEGRYGPRSPFEMGDPFDEAKPAMDAARTSLDALGLSMDRCFFYWFDFGDDWYHRVSVLAIGQTEPKVKYPRVIARVGESPPQYMDDEE